MCFNKRLHLATSTASIYCPLPDMSCRIYQAEAGTRMISSRSHRWWSLVPASSTGMLGHTRGYQEQGQSAGVWG